jgi:excisionase family DNA binding protein
MAMTWLSIRDGSRYIGRSVPFVYREIRAGRIRAARVGRGRRLTISQEWLDAYLIEASMCPLHGSEREAGAVEPKDVLACHG